MRLLATALLLTLPLAAAAQTPADIARALPQCAARSSAAPSQVTAGGALAAADIARLSGASGLAAQSAPTPHPAAAGAFSAGDLARLAGHTDPALAAAPMPVYTTPRRVAASADGGSKRD